MKNLLVSRFRRLARTTADRNLTVGILSKQLQSQLYRDIGVRIILLRNKLMHTDILPMNIFFQYFTINGIKITDQMSNIHSSSVGKGQAAVHSNHFIIFIFFQKREGKIVIDIASCNNQYFHSYFLNTSRNPLTLSSTEPL